MDRRGNLRPYRLRYLQHPISTRRVCLPRTVNAADPRPRRLGDHQRPGRHQGRRLGRFPPGISQRRAPRRFVRFAGRRRRLFAGSRRKKNAPRNPAGPIDRHTIRNAVYRLAGILGIDPDGRYTLRALDVAVTARRRNEWDHTAAIIATLANCHRDPKKRRTPYQPKDFHPDYAVHKKRDRVAAPITALKLLIPK